jgi:hypothetical protein
MSASQRKHSCAPADRLVDDLADVRILQLIRFPGTMA